MQDRYAGDIGDYVKLGLLRAISAERKLGIAWYRFSDESHNEDGRHIAYLEKPEKFAHVDPQLFEHLRTVVRYERSIKSLLPTLNGVSSFEESLDVSSVPVRERREWRKAWFARATEHISDCDIVFADPDNGIIDDSDKRGGRAKFGKQIPLHEVRALADGRCAIIYHHNTRRRGGHDAEVDHWLYEIDMPGLAIRATAFSPRTFFVVNPDREIEQRVRRFCDRWQDLKVRLHAPGTTLVP